MMRAWRSSARRPVPERRNRVREGFAVSILAAIIALAASCWSPTFDAALSASELTAAKMSAASTIVVTNMQVYRAERGLFMPRRIAAPVDGIWLAGEGPTAYSFESIRPYYLAAANADYVFASGRGQYSGDPLAMPIARMAPSGVLEAIAFADKGATLDGLVRAYASAASPPSIYIDESAPNLPGPGALLGAGFASESESAESAFAVYYDDSLMAYRAATVSYPALAIFSGEAIAMPSGLSPTGVGFAARTSSYCYLSITETSGAYRTFRWPTAGLVSAPEELIGVTAPLIAVLFDGTLLAGDGMAITAYDASGTRLYSFPSGSLRFVHERLDTGAGWVSVFVRQVFIGDGSGERGTMRIETYEIPSASLPTLAR